MTLFKKIAELADHLAGTGSRLAKRANIAESIAAVHATASGEEALFCLYLAGLPFAESDPRKLNAGVALLTKAVLTVSGASQVELTAAYRRHGDLGAAAFDLFAAKPTLSDKTAEGGAPGVVAGLSLAEVAEAFAGMATAKTRAIRAGLVVSLWWR